MSDSYAKMSDMASHRITVRVPKALGDRLVRRSRAKGRTPSDLVRIALEDYLGTDKEGESAYDAAKAAGLIGCVSDGPKDLSTHKRHFEGFGKGR